MVFTLCMYTWKIFIKRTWKSHPIIQHLCFPNCAIIVLERFIRTRRSLQKFPGLFDDSVDFPMSEFIPYRIRTRFDRVSIRTLSCHIFRICFQFLIYVNLSFLKKKSFIYHLFDILMRSVVFSGVFFFLFL